MNDWRRAIKTPISYSVPGTSTSLQRQQTNFVSFVVISGALVLFILFTFVPQPRTIYSQLDDEHGHSHEKLNSCVCCNSESLSYNQTRTLIERLEDGRLKYHIAAIADLDKKSKSPNTNSYLSYLLKGTFIFNPLTSAVELKWSESELELSSKYSLGGRGMELSDLVVFNGKLYSCDDRTGIVYEINGTMALPWVILRDGNGETTQKGFKCEWMLVKDQHLFVGGLGKEWTSSTGTRVLNQDPQYVKRISPSGVVEHIDWRHRYNALKQSVNIESPGYLIHEAVIWSEKSKLWYFLPRRASKDPYDDLLDEQRGTNILISANEHFTNITRLGVVGPLIKTHGFSSVKLLPLPSDVRLEPQESEIAIALKSEETSDIISTYVIVFRVPDGHILYPETKISSKHKYEGIEFI